jgi:pyruvate/2-oxoglutarate dehydrogenase complex dihydrolipoamide dehydrogenase (E3) component
MMPQQDDSPIATPQDVYERERLANVHPTAWTNPKNSGCYQLAIVGAGPAGLAAAEMAAGLGIKVSLIERNSIGGTNVNIGSVPSKTLIRTSRLYAEMRDAIRFGAQVPTDIRVDFTAVME